MNIKCCKNCTDRSASCHATCKRYIDEKAELDKWNTELKEIKKGRSDAIAVREDRLAKSHIKCNLGQK